MTHHNTYCKSDPIIVFPLNHRERLHIGLRFNYDQELIDRIKQLPGRRYSKTHNCWYIPYTDTSFSSFKQLNVPYEVIASDTIQLDLNTCPTPVLEKSETRADNINIET